jgi:4-hydroxy-tetrahydrodipicolinate reductase
MVTLVHLGLGPLGQKIVRYACERGMRYAAAVDPDPAKAGRDLGEVCGLSKLGVTVSRTLDEALAAGRRPSPAVALVTTVSSLAKIEPQVAALARAGIHAVSTCEELVYPWRTHPEIAGRIDRLCKKHGVACLGTGVNPGFLMDWLPIAVTGVCQRVDGITISRVQDASVRRVPFQQKIGAGLDLEGFRLKEEAGTLRHVGLRESIDLIASRLGWRLDRTDETLEPVIADRDIASGHVPIRAGMARGVHQVARAYRDGREVITLDFLAAVGEPTSYDRIRIQGEPTLDLRFEGGVNGDVATCAICLNAIRSVLSCGPGLKTMCDVPTVSFSREG